MLAFPSKPRNPLLLVVRAGDLAPGSEWAASSTSSPSGSDGPSAPARRSAAKSSIPATGSCEEEARRIPPEICSGLLAHVCTWRTRWSDCAVDDDVVLAGRGCVTCETGVRSSQSAGTEMQWPA